MENNRYFRGLLGAIIGAILFSIPWVLVYVYAGWILSMLGMVIGYGAHIFYKLFGAKDDKRTVIIVVIASLLAITLATFVFIPLLLIIKDGYDMQYFYVLYDDSDFIGSIIHDYIISVFFTILGVSAVTTSIKKKLLQIENGNDFVDPYFFKEEEKLKYMEEIFAKYNAFSKENAVSELVILKDIKSVYKSKLLQYYEFKGIICSSNIKNKCYFDKEAALNPSQAKKNRKKLIIIPIVIGILVFVIGIIMGLGLIFYSEEKEEKQNDINISDSKLPSYKTFNFDGLSIKLEDTFKVDDQTEKSVRYINNESSNALSYVMIFKEVALLDDEEFQAFEENYINYLRDEMTIVEQENVIYSLKGFHLKTYSNMNKNIHYHIYLLHDIDCVYGFVFWGNITGIDEFDTKNRDNILNSDTETAMKTLKINKNNEM